MANPGAGVGVHADDYHQMGYIHGYHTWSMEYLPHETMTDYFNRIALEITDDVEYRWGIHRFQDRFAPHIPLHQNFQILRDLAPQQPTEKERLADISDYALPRPVAITHDQTAETPPSRQVLYYRLAVVTCFAAVIIYRLL